MEPEALHQEQVQLQQVLARLSCRTARFVRNCVHVGHMLSGRRQVSFVQRQALALVSSCEFFYKCEVQLPFSFVQVLFPGGDITCFSRSIVLVREIENCHVVELILSSS